MSQVAPRNLVSRIDADPSPPTRVTHVAFSSDGSAMATLDVTDGLQVRCASVEMCGTWAYVRLTAFGLWIQADSAVMTLRFWSWSGQDERYVLKTRVQVCVPTWATCL
jgi:hypothetical protein